MKYFGIGLSRTGTSTLSKAFDTLGYRTKHYMNVNEYGQFYVDGSQYDFINDMPIYWKFEELDVRFPNSKFIYTYRNYADWKDSCTRYFTQQFTKPHVRSDVSFKSYWSTFFKGEENSVDNIDFEKVYNDHHQRVVDYFHSRPDDILTIKITEGEGWDVLCPFLDIPQPTADFPTENVFVDL